jgi:glycosyltransferase involved in cell wall biosynthesis
MKVLHICNGAQGQSPFYKFLFQALKKHQVEQSIIAPVWKTPTIDFEDIPCEYFYRDSGILARLMFLGKIRKLTKFAIEKFDIKSFNIIHAHTWFSDGAVAYELYKKYKIPYIIAIRNTDINIFYKYFLHLRKLGYNILENAAQIIFISPAYKSYFSDRVLPWNLRRKILHNISVIPNGVSPFWLNHIAQKTAVSSPAKLLSVGAITPNKNFLTLCHAVDLLKNMGVEVELTIVGKGYKDRSKYLKKLENFIKEKPYIKILEQQSGEQLLQTYRAHDIFVLPSHTETFGLVYIEALTQGLPIIYTQKQGIDGYFEYGEVGFAIPPTHINDIAGAILVSIRDYAKFTEHIGNLDFSEFDWGDIAGRYLEVYQE